MENIASLKQQLLTEQKELNQELTQLGIQDLSAPADWVATPDEPADGEADENVLADRNEEWMIRRSEMVSLETRYNNIVRALEKMAAQAYGTCEICNEPIEADRLEANAAARTCKTHLNDEVQLAL